MQHVFVELEPMPWRVSALRSARRVLFKPKNRKSFSNLTPEEVAAIVNRVKRDGPLKRLMGKLKPSLKSFIKQALNVKGLLVVLDKTRKMISIGKMTRLAGGFAVKQQIQVMLEQGNKLRIDGQIVRKNINGAAESVAKIGKDVVVKVKRTGVDLSGRMEIAFVQGKMWVREQASSLAKFLPAASASQIIESLRKLPENLVKVTRQADDILLKDLAGNVIATFNKKGMQVKRWVDLTYGGTVQNIKGKIREIFSGRFLAKNKRGKLGICLRNGTCFVAGTLIYVSSSFQPIEQIQAGNQVHSGDPKSCEQSSKNVEATFVRTTPILVKLGFNQENIYATPEHPFFNLRNEQILAGNLKKGDTLKTYDGYEIVQNTRSIDTMATVYNFHVKDFHTYYVGKTKLWVHNMMSHQLIQQRLQTKIDELFANQSITNDEISQLANDMAQSRAFSGMMNGRVEFLDSWLVLKRAGLDQSARINKASFMGTYMRNNQKTIQTMMQEITTAKGFERWEGLNIIRKKWTIFDETNNAAFYDRLEKFTGNNRKFEADHTGGEGHIWLSRNYPGKALKRWVKKRLGGFNSSIQQMQAMAKYIDNNPALAKDLDIVRIYGGGPDWIIRDFDIASVELQRALSANMPGANAAFTRVKAALSQSSNPLIQNISKKLNRGSDNLHWSEDRKKILIIDIDGI